MKPARTTLVKLAKVVQTGWADQRAEIDPDLHAFWIHRWNLSIIDGVIMNGTRIVIPKSLQDENLRCDGKPHVIIVDYYSFFIYERPMPDMSSEMLILALKTIFSESGVPNILITDNGRSTVLRNLNSLAWNGPSYTKHHHPTIHGKLLC